MGPKNVMADLGIQTTCVMKVGCTAAKRITNRRGHGIVKHLQTRELWLQDIVKDKRIDIQKVATIDNPADLVTMHLDSKTAAGRLKRLSARTATGWHELPPRLKTQQCL